MSDQTPFGIHLGDSRELLLSVPDGSVDLLLTDPPYNVTRKNQFHTMGRTGIEFDFDGDFDICAWIPLAAAKVRGGGSAVVWNDWKNIGMMARAFESLGWLVKRELIWEKSNPMPRNTSRLPVQGREHGFWAIKPKTKSRPGWTFNFTPSPEKPYHRGTFVYPVQRGSKNPTKKPPKMFAELVELFSNPGDTVLDPYLGAGTTAQAAAMTGRRVIGIELNPAYFEEAQENFKEASASLDSPPPAPATAEAP